MTTTRLTCALAALSIPWLALAAPVVQPRPGPQQRARPGLWEISSRFEMIGFALPIPPQTVTQCFTKEDIERPERRVPEAVPGCKVGSLRQSGDRTTWRVECTGEVSGEGEGEAFQRSPTAYDGNMTVRTHGVTMKVLFKGRRLSDCK